MRPQGAECAARRHLAALLLALGALSLPATTPPSAAQVAPELSEPQLLEIARHAPPAPEPPLDEPGVHLDDEVARRVASSVTAYGRALDLIAPADDPRGLPPAEISLPARRAARAGGGSAPAEVESTMPTPVYDTLQPPWNAVAKLLMRFRVDGKSHFYSCSGVLIGPFHVATAGHCIFNWDPNGDGRMDDAAWADDVWVWQAQTDTLAPFGVPERPFGESRSVLNRAYEGWTVGRDVGWDIALLTLNRRTVDAAGWMGLDVDNPVASLGFSGYPVEEPYVPPSTVVQYGGSGPDNVARYGDRQVMLNVYTYGGHSGGPVWRSDDTGNGYWLQGIMSVSDRRGYAVATLVTDANTEDFITWMSSDYAERAPIPRPDLCEYVLAPAAKALLADSVRQGETVGVTFNVFNSGAAESGPIAIDFYLSTNTLMADRDFFVTRRVLDSLSANAFLVATTDLTIPATVPVGNYYLGWLMRAMDTEYSTANNSAVIGDQMLRVERAFTPTPTATPTPQPTATSTASPEPTQTPTEMPACLGDCGGDRRVTVDELILMVTIGLGMVPVDSCPNGDADHDGQVAISEVIASVRHALDGCARGPAA
ncbi:MAG TPA: trypsin-like peptidase domain-containing protein [Candidatus Dormibacteraeota bacterium]|nr:trypsin-like peptidase domain-containing protein [Candidatus Dormibacteraeota bacterium]